VRAVRQESIKTNFINRFASSVPLVSTAAMDFQNVALASPEPMHLRLYAFSVQWATTVIPSTQPSVLNALQVNIPTNRAALLAMIVKQGSSKVIIAARCAMIVCLATSSRSEEWKFV